MQDPRSYSPPPPDKAVIARRNLRFNRLHGYRK
jgi:hypothetical protein